MLRLIALRDIPEHGPDSPLCDLVEFEIIQPDLATAKQIFRSKGPAMYTEYVQGLQGEASTGHIVDLTKWLSERMVEKSPVYWQLG